MKYRIRIITRNNGSKEFYIDRKLWPLGFWKTICPDINRNTFCLGEADAKHIIARDFELYNLTKEQKRGLKVRHTTTIIVKKLMDALYLKNNPKP